MGEGRSGPMALGARSLALNCDLDTSQEGQFGSLWLLCLSTSALFLSSGAVATFTAYVANLRLGLQDIGHVEGSNVAVEYRWTHGPGNDRVAFVEPGKSKFN